jgi:large subunit ribosomal protein L6
MSRLAKKPIPVPAGVNVEERGASWVFTGPKGEITNTFSPLVSIEVGSTGVVVTLKASSKSKSAPAILGTTAALVRNALVGVSAGYEKKLEIEGVGYKVQQDGKDLTFALGFSHPVKYPAPEGITLTAEKNTILIKGVDKQKVGQVAAEIRAQKKPEPYKGKGIHYMGEVIRRKAGKKAASTA